MCKFNLCIIFEKLDHTVYKKASKNGHNVHSSIIWGSTWSGII